MTIEESIFPSVSNDCEKSNHVRDFFGISEVFAHNLQSLFKETSTSDQVMQSGVREGGCL
jgi:hypothetical protein